MNSDISKWFGLLPFRSLARLSCCGSKSLSGNSLISSWAGRHWQVLLSWLSWCQLLNASVKSSAWSSENSWRWRISESTRPARHSKVSSLSSCKHGSDRFFSEFLEFGLMNCLCCEGMCMSKPCRNVFGIRLLIWCLCWVSLSSCCWTINLPPRSRLRRFLCNSAFFLWLVDSIFYDRPSRDSQTFAFSSHLTLRRSTASQSAVCRYNESKDSF